MISKERSDQVFGGVFLIGLAILFLTSYWWPGLLFVLGIAMLAQTYTQGKALTSNTRALILLGLGVLFALAPIASMFGGLPIVPLVLIGIGLYVLFGDRLRGK